MPEQGFRLQIGADRTRLDWRDAAGKRYGQRALAQIREQATSESPALLVEDWPDFPVRGYMLDISRDRVPTRATLERIVGILDLLRINHFELYTEHTFAYAGHQVVWRDASPMTAEDLRWLDDLCSAAGIELVANQNGFGHMQRWLKHEPYRSMAEAPQGWTTSWGEHWRPAVLYPDERSLAFVLSLYDELLPSFASRCVNIGCDETFELGKGRSKQRVAEVGRGRVYLDFVGKIVEHLHARDRRVLFWGDVIRQHGELIDELPRGDTTALLWHYEAPIENPSLPDGLEKILGEVGINEDVLRGFAGQVPAFAEAALPFWVCPGTSTWNSLLGRWTNARDNLLDAAVVGAAAGAGGYLITDWGDNGHMQPLSVSFPPLAFGACLAWCERTNRDIDLDRALDRFVFADDSHRLSAAMCRAAEIYRQSGAEAFNGSPLFYALIGNQASLTGRGAPTASGMQTVVEELAAVEAECQRANPACEDGDLIKREVQQAVRLSRLGAVALAGQHDLAVTSDAGDPGEALQEQRACWLARSRPGGLEDSIARIRP